MQWCAKSREENKILKRSSNWPKHPGGPHKRGTVTVSFKSFFPYKSVSNTRRVRAREWGFLCKYSHILKFFHHWTLLVKYPGIVFPECSCWGWRGWMRWWIEDAQLAAYLYHADAWPTVFHHFASLLTGCTVIGEPCDSTVAPSPLATWRLEKKATSTCLMFLE